MTKEERQEFISETIEKFKKEIKIDGFIYDDSVGFETETITFVPEDEGSNSDYWIDISCVEVVGHDDWAVLVSFTKACSLAGFFIIEDEERTPEFISKFINDKKGDFYG